MFLNQLKNALFLGNSKILAANSLKMSSDFARN